MALVVEDGTGKDNANALIKHSFALTYWADRGRAVVKRGADDATKPFLEGDTVAVGTKTYTAAQIDAAIVRATAYLSESFQYRGIRTYGRNSTADGADRFQALAWPRYGVYDREGAWVPSSGAGAIPREIQWATAEASFYELEKPNGLQPVYEQNKVIQQVRAGSAQVTFDTDKVSASGARPKLTVLLDLIGEFLAVGAGNSLVGTAVRG